MIKIIILVKKFSEGHFPSKEPIWQSPLCIKWKLFSGIETICILNFVNFYLIYVKLLAFYVIVWVFDTLFFFVFNIKKTLISNKDPSW